MDYFNNSLQHILAEMERLEILVQMQVWRVRQLNPEQDPLTAYYIPDEEIDISLELPFGTPLWASVPLPDELVSSVQTKLDTLAARLEIWKTNSHKQGIPLRMEMLAEMFQLTAFDLDAILVCLAPEMDLRFIRLYAYLQDDLNRKHPSVDLLLNLLCPQLESKTSVQSRLSPTAPLLANELIHLLPPSGSTQAPYLAHGLKLDERIRRFLLEEDTPDSRIVPLVKVIKPPSERPFLAPNETIIKKLLALTQQTGRQLFYFQGPYGTGRQAAAETLAQALKRPLLLVRGERLERYSAEELAHLTRLITREARLQNAILYWAALDWLLDEEQSLRREVVLEILAERPDLTIIAGDTPWQPGQADYPHPFTHIPFHMPAAAERHRLWRKLIDGRSENINLEAAANQFRLSGGQIQDAAATARNLARRRDPENATLESADLFAASRLHSSQKLTRLAQKIRPHHSWQDIILPAEQLAQLRALCDQVIHRAQVLERWGFEQKLALGRGTHALFTGRPGTGKTMAAGILAGELELDLYKIDLSSVVSKYIGETEKNLSRIFAEAETTNAILFFDEADALFGKRTEVKDSHDRYANLEISYLLQKMDEYDGVVILATNFRENLDQAFIRRIRFIVEFPMPTAKDRRKIWQGIWPEQAPLGEEVDMGWLAENLEITGGNIRNIALSAAFLAAAEAGQEATITMRHLLEATESEYKKIGKLFSRLER